MSDEQDFGAFGDDAVSASESGSDSDFDDFSKSQIRKEKRNHLDDPDSESDTEGFSNRQKSNRTRDRKRRNKSDEKDLIFIPQKTSQSNDSEVDDRNEIEFKEILGEVNNFVGMSNDQFRELTEKKEKSKKHLPNVALKTLGTWEKHTKGFGMKMLQKFGFKGRLGADESGVSRPLEVEVRPSGLGLGFGEKPEAASLNANKRFEAEWKGIELPPAPEQQMPLNGGANAGLSQVEQLARGKSWRRRRDGDDDRLTGGREAREGGEDRRTGSKRARRKGLTPEELLAEHEQLLQRQQSRQVIIDMRGEEARVITDLGHVGTAQQLSGAISTTRIPLLGEELLYNIDLVVELVGAAVGADSRRLVGLGGLRAQVQEAEAEIERAERSLQRDEPRLDRLERLSAALSRVAERHDHAAATAAAGGHEDPPSVEDACRLLGTLHEHFSEEFRVLGLALLLPELAKPGLAQLTATCRQMMMMSSDVDDEADGRTVLADRLAREVRVTFSPMQELVELLSIRGDAPAAGQLSEAVARAADDALVPLLRQAVAGGSWADCYDPRHSPLGLMAEAALYLAPVQLSSLLEMMVLPRLQQAIAAWTPFRDPPADRWLLPWLPLLREKLAALYPEHRRRLALFLRSWDDIAGVDVLAALRPWVSVWDAGSLQALLIRSVAPRVASALRSLVIDPASQELRVAEAALRWRALLPAGHFSMLWLGEFFPRWLAVLARWLCAPSADFEEVSAWYSGWREFFSIRDAVQHSQVGAPRGSVVDPSMDIEAPLVHDSFAAPFSAALAMMTLALEEQEGLDENRLLAIASTHGLGAGQSYLSLVQTQEREQQVRTRLQELSQPTPSSARRNATGAVSSASFKEVVEAFAERSGVLFQPRAGSREGHQLYTFGSCLCYIDRNVLFAPQSTSSSSPWGPVALEDLLERARSQ